MYARRKLWNICQRFQRINNITINSSNYSLNAFNTLIVKPDNENNKEIFFTAVRKISDLTKPQHYEVIDPKHKKMSYSIKNSQANLSPLIDTIGDRLTIMAKHRPNDTCYKFLFSNENFTYTDLFKKVEKYSQALLEMGFKKGDRIAIMLPNVPEYIISIFAATSIGLIAVLMNPAYQQVEIEYMLKKTGAKGIIMLDELRVLKHLDILKRICPELEFAKKGQLESDVLPNLKHVVIVNSFSKKTHSSTWNFKELEELAKRSHEKPIVEMDDSCLMLFTSGTTGLPKGAVLTHFNILNTVQLESLENGCRHLNTVVCCPIPIFHVFGILVGLLSPLLTGNLTIFPHFFPDTLTTIKAIAKEKCTSLKGPPVIFIDILNHPDLKNYDLSSLKVILISASTVPLDVVYRMKNELKLTKVLIAYGMTETSGCGTGTVDLDEFVSERYAYESIGKVAPFMECKIIDTKTKQIVPRNVDGEICFRGYNVMKEYWGDKEKTAETIDENGWLMTGDIACMDENGYLFFKTRAKELIIRGGVNIYPAEIESFLRTIPEVIDAYVLGVPDERYGEDVCAWIKLRPECEGINADRIREICKDKIAYFKIPRHIRFVNSFPVNATGKVQKFKMLQIMKDEFDNNNNNNNNTQQVKIN